MFPALLKLRKEQGLALKSCRGWAGHIGRWMRLLLILLKATVKLGSWIKRN